MFRNLMRKFYVLTMLVVLSGCTGIPDNVEPVTGFELERYLGDWYEIARLDHSFERGLEKITASYSMREDGGVRVLNRGYDVEKGEWREAEGKAYFIDDPGIGRHRPPGWGCDPPGPVRPDAVEHRHRVRGENRRDQTPQQLHR